MLKKDKIILFDLDGTLIDSTEAICESFCEAFKVHKKEIPPQELMTQKIGHTLEDIFDFLGIQQEEIPSYVLAYKEHYRKVCNVKTYLLKNTKEAILESDKFAHLGIVTTKTSRFSKELLEHFGLLKYFKCVIGRENVLNPKPDAEGILMALDLLPKCPKENIVMIGDTPLDILAAQSARIQCIAVLSGYAPLELLQKHTHCIAQDSLEAIRNFYSTDINNL